MPLKRALQSQDKENSPPKRNAPNIFSPMTGTQTRRPTAGDLKAAGKKMNPLPAKEPMSDAERITFFRSKVKKSLKDLMKHRQKLETLVPVEDSSELKSLLLMSPADLQTELKRHELLTAKISSSVAHRGATNKNHFQALKQTRGSSEFLKMILRTMKGGSINMSIYDRWSEGSVEVLV
ncbi:hypothetical protein DNTS_015551 [Danionella cerebrum]|uniref:Centromere protein R n=1 Tax=Danionella cerebrum TaxID=2873325 RepID=A0A553MLD6_9TELE|nr:hypothetical protein DNTS_015551 [Danionella translucida]